MFILFLGLGKVQLQHATRLQNSCFLFRTAAGSPAALHTDSEQLFSVKDSGRFNCSTPRGLQNSIVVRITEQRCSPLLGDQFLR
jgi:hypothetical protein